MLAERGLFFSPSQLTFTLIITTSTLQHNGNYSANQSELTDEIIRLRDQRLSFKQIAEQLNERGIQSTRQRPFYAALVFALLKKRQVRDLRLVKLPQTNVALIE